MNSCPYTISHEAPLPQVFNLFRTMGLRHLPVMQESGIVSSNITAHSLYYTVTVHMYRIISQIRPPRDNAPPPNSFDENYCAGTISVQTLTVTNNLCDVYKTLYYAVVYVRGHFC